MSKLEKYLKEVEERLNNATEGPWCVNSGNVHQIKSQAEIAECFYDNNSEFIAYSRTDVEVLLRMVTALLEERNVKAFDIYGSFALAAYQLEEFNKQLELLIPKESEVDLNE